MNSFFKKNLKRILELISLLSALTGSLLAYSDQLSPITSLNPKFAHVWPVIGGASVVLKILASLIGDYLADKPFVAVSKE